MVLGRLGWQQTPLGVPAARLWLLVMEPGLTDAKSLQSSAARVGWFTELYHQRHIRVMGQEPIYGAQILQLILSPAKHSTSGLSPLQVKAAPKIKVLLGRLAQGFWSSPFPLAESQKEEFSSLASQQVQTNPHRETQDPDFPDMRFSLYETR